MCFSLGLVYTHRLWVACVSLTLCQSWCSSCRMRRCLFNLDRSHCSLWRACHSSRSSCDMHDIGPTGIVSNVNVCHSGVCMHALLFTINTNHSFDMWSCIVRCSPAIRNVYLWSCPHNCMIVSVNDIIMVWPVVNGIWNYCCEVQTMLIIRRWNSSLS